MNGPAQPPAPLEPEAHSPSWVLGFVRPSTTLVLLLTLAVLLLMRDGLGLPDGLLRFIGVAAAGSCLGLGAALLAGARARGPAWLRRLREDGWVREVPFPYFDEELDPNEREALRRLQQAAPERSWGWMLVAVSVWIACLTLAPGLTRSTQPDAEVWLRPSERVARLDALHVPGGVAVQLPGEIEFVSLSGEGVQTRVVVGQWDLRTSTRVDVELGLGDRAGLFGRSLRFAEVERLADAQGARLRVRSDSDEGDAEILELQRGGRAALASGETLELVEVEVPSELSADGRVTWRLLDASGDERIVGSSVFGAAAFASRHAVEGWVVDAVEPLPGVRIRLVQTPPPPRVAWGAMAIAGLLFLVGIARREPSWFAGGRSGDRVLVRFGPLAARDEEMPSGLVSPTRQAEMEALLTRLRSGGGMP